MPQVFPEWSNKAPIYLAIGLAVVALAAPAFIWYYFSPEYTDVGYRPEQPIPYSHKVHAGQLEIDCRYCHAQVEVAAVASVPPTQVCMNCHQLVKRDSPLLEPLRQSVANDQGMQWVRVHKVPEYAYFDHGVHVRAGVGCSSCHGDVAQMEVVTQMEPLSMGWCLECHRDPDAHLRPADEITNTAWKPPKNQLELAARFKDERQIAPPEDCSACHR